MMRSAKIRPAFCLAISRQLPWGHAGMPPLAGAHCTSPEWSCFVVCLLCAPLRLLDMTSTIFCRHVCSCYGLPVACWVMMTSEW